LEKKKEVVTMDNRDISFLLAGIGIYFLFFRKTHTGGMSLSDADVDAMTRMLAAETDLARGQDEMVGIAQVAINRSHHSGNSIYDVVTPPGRPNWNGSSAYLRRYNDAHLNPLFEGGKDFVRDILSGNYQNRIGDRRMFVHPSGMKRQGCSSATLNQECPDNSSRLCADTIAGARCLPRWVHPSHASVKVVDKAMFA